MIKSLIIRFFEYFSDPVKALRQAEHEAIVEARKNITLKGSMQERLAATREWSKPENVAERAANYKAGIGEPKKYPPLPDPPPEKYMVGQTPSTMMIMLAEEGWVYNYNKKEWQNKRIKQLCQSYHS